MIKVTTNGGREDGWIRQPLKDIKEYKGHNTQKGSRGAERPSTHFGLMFIITTAVQHWYWWVRQNVCGCGCSGIPVLPERWWMTHDKHQYFTSIFRISCTSFTNTLHPLCKAHTYTPYKPPWSHQHMLQYHYFEVHHAQARGYNESCNYTYARVFGETVSSVHYSCCSGTWSVS